MSKENNIPYNNEINNFIIKLGLSLYLTLLQLKHVCEFIFATVGRGYNGKVTHITENCYQSTYRTSVGKFLSESPWNEKITKIDIAVAIISSLPKQPIKGFVLGDSWYSAEIIIKSAKAKGFEYIGALKTNRVIYPKYSCMNHKINGFAKIINKEEFHLVTVNKHSYYVYRYKGKINGFEKAVVLISYPK